MSNGNGVSRGDRNRNARMSRLRELVPVTNGIVGIDLADSKQMVVVTDHDSKVLARRWFRCRASIVVLCLSHHRLGLTLDPPVNTSPVDRGSESRRTSRSWRIRYRTCHNLRRLHGHTGLAGLATTSATPPSRA